MLWYSSRHYDPALGRFISPDTIVPLASQGVQAWDRYAYANNAPTRYTDPTGHCIDGLLTLICLAAAALVTSIVVQQAAVRDAYNGSIDQGIANVKTNSPTSADALVGMFTANDIPGDSAQERLDAVLDGTRNEPGQYFEEQFTDTGFNENFKDPWGEASNNQVGHFLTAAALANNSSGQQADYAALSAIIGHELVSDTEGTYAQVSAGNNSDLHNLFLTGTEENFELIMSFSANGQGNSIEDLRLSYMGWVFGKSIANGNIFTRTEAAEWLQAHLK